MMCIWYTDTHVMSYVVMQIEIQDSQYVVSMVER